MSRTVIPETTVHSTFLEAAPFWRRLPRPWQRIIPEPVCREYAATRRYRKPARDHTASAGVFHSCPAGNSGTDDAGGAKTVISALKKEIENSKQFLEALKKSKRELPRLKAEIEKMRLLPAKQMRRVA